MAKTFKEHSKEEWAPVGERQATNEELKLGCLQRIADATELMAKNYLGLQSQLNLYKAWYSAEREKTAKLEKTITGLKGVIGKYKKKNVHREKSSAS